MKPGIDRRKGVGGMGTDGEKGYKERILTPLLKFQPGHSVLP